METDTDAGHDTLASLRRMGLLDDDDAPVLTPLTGGVSSVILRVDGTTASPYCVKRALAQLKVAAHWEAPVSRNRAEVAWMRVAGRIIPHAVPAILGDDAEGCAFAMAYLPTGTHPVWKQQLRDGHVDVSLAQAVGSLLARLHAATAHNPALAAQFAHDEQFHALRLAPYFLATAERHPAHAEVLHALVARTADTRLALVHGDVSPKNILAGPHGPILLDAECAWYGDPAFDLAFCLTHLLLKTVWQPAHTPAYLACYDALAIEYLAGVTWEPPDALEARACALLAGLLLARVDGKSPAEYLDTDDASTQVRRAALPLLLQPAARLADLRHRWNHPA